MNRGLGFFSPKIFSTCCLAGDRPKYIAVSAGAPPDPVLGPPWLGSCQEMGQGRALCGDVGRDACGAGRARGRGSPSRSSPALVPPVSFLAALPARAARTCLPWPPAEGWYASILPPCPRVPLPLLVSHETPPPCPHGVPLTVCLLSPRWQDSRSQDSSTEMVGCSARLMPGFSFCRWCFSACSALGPRVHHLPPGVWVPHGAAVTKSSLVTRSASALPSWL